MPDKVKIHVLDCGRVRVDRAVPFKEKTLHPVPWSGFLRSKDYQIWLPVTAFLIEHPMGLVLVDTGWSPEVRTDPIGHLGRLHYMANIPKVDEGKAINEQLAIYGVKPSDLDYVVISHLDDDHGGGLRLVADAKNILVSKQEWKSANNRLNIRYRRANWKGVNISPFSFGPSEFGPFKSAYDLFDDGSVVLVDAPGHSEGMTATLVRNGGRFVLITGDAAYAKNSWEKMISPGITPDTKRAMVTLSWIALMSKQPECIEILATHDPDVVRHTIEL